MKTLFLLLLVAVASRAATLPSIINLADFHHAEAGNSWGSVRSYYYIDNLDEFELKKILASLGDCKIQKLNEKEAAVLLDRKATSGALRFLNLYRASGNYDSAVMSVRITGEFIIDYDRSLVYKLDPYLIGSIIGVIHGEVIVK